jgi:hypothetical protein
MIALENFANNTTRLTNLVACRARQNLREYRDRLVLHRLRHLTRTGSANVVSGVEARAVMKITVRLYDGRVVVGTVCAIEETVAGIKVRIVSGNYVLTANANQIINLVPTDNDLALEDAISRVRRVSKRDIEKRSHARKVTNEGDIERR